VNIIDAHCDALYKMAMRKHARFLDDENYFDVTYQGLKQANISLQFFAIYLSGKSSPPTFDDIIEHYDLFYRNILSYSDVMLVKNRKDLKQAVRDGKLGALLSLEGVDALGGNFAYLRAIYEMGIRAAGVTWNDANWAADGVMEPRQGGLTAKGKQLVRECNRLGIILDVSHLSVRGFWDLAEICTRPFIASHSNAYSVCPHPRNLNDEQIREIIRKGGMIGITFVPQFVSAAENPTISHLLQHIEYICSLGGSEHLGFGSDFDGTDKHMEGLAKVRHYENLANELLKRYNAGLVNNWLYKNWYVFLENQLPDDEP